MHHANGVVWEAVSPPPPPPDGSRANRRAESPPTAAHFFSFFTYPLESFMWSIFTTAT